MCDLDTTGASSILRIIRSDVTSHRHGLWSRFEDDILVETVPKYTTSDVFSRSWRQVVSDLPGYLPQKYKEYYRLVDTVTQLTSVFLCVLTHRCLGYRNHTSSMTVTTKLIHHCVSKDTDTT